MFIWIQALRGLAAAMVVCHHYVAAQAGRGADVGQWLLYFGGSGVDIFFVISGFIMTITQLGSAGDFSARRFLARRLLRIAPLYWMLTAAAFALASLASGSINTHIDLGKFLMSMLFLPYSEPTIEMSTDAYRAYVIPMAWTLTYEWFFYLVFALALALGLRPVARLRFMAFCFTGCAVAGVACRPSAPLLQVVTSPLIFEFLLGSLVAALHMRGMRLKDWQAGLLALAASGVLVNIFHDSAATRVLVWGAAAFALIAAAALSEGSKANMVFIRPFARLGDVSYSLYLSHFFTLALFVRVQERLYPLDDAFSPLTISVFILLALSVATLSYRCIEEPAREFFAKRRNERSLVR